MSAGEYQPTLQDIAKAEARRLKKEQAKQQKAAAAKIQDPRGNILPREWAEISSASPGKTIRVMTWNVSIVVDLWAVAAARLTSLGV